MRTFLRVFICIFAFLPHWSSAGAGLSSMQAVDVAVLARGVRSAWGKVPKSLADVKKMRVARARARGVAAKRSPCLQQMGVRRAVVVRKSLERPKGSPRTSSDADSTVMAESPSPVGYKGMSDKRRRQEMDREARCAERRAVNTAHKEARSILKLDDENDFWQIKHNEILERGRLAKIKAEEAHADTVRLRNKAFEAHAEELRVRPVQQEAALRCQLRDLVGDVDFLRKEQRSHHNALISKNFTDMVGWEAYHRLAIRLSDCLIEMGHVMADLAPAREMWDGAQEQILRAEENKIKQEKELGILRDLSSEHLCVAVGL